MRSLSMIIEDACEIILEAEPCPHHLRDIVTAATVDAYALGAFENEMDSVRYEDTTDAPMALPK